MVTRGIHYCGVRIQSLIVIEVSVIYKKGMKFKSTVGHHSHIMHVKV